MADLNTLMSRVRLEIGDLPVQFTTKLLGDGTTKDFYVKVKPLEASYLLINTVVATTTTVTGTTTTVAASSVVGTAAAVVYAQGGAGATGFTVEEDLGVLHFNSAPPANSTITVSGTHYRYFANKDIVGFLNTAVAQHTYNRTDSFGRQMTLSLIPAVEEYPLSLLASIEALWTLATDSAFDINISAPDGVQIPRSQRFAQLTNIIAQRKEQYRELCAQLNIGLWRVEMGTLRRVSRTTNKLVPIYVAQEVDDSRAPERVYMQNDLTGRTPVPTTAQPYDIVMVQGDSWSAVFDFPDPSTGFDLTQFTIRAQIRSYPQSPTLIASFNSAITSTAQNKLTLSLTSDQTSNFPVKAYWDLQLSQVSNGTVVFEQTYIQGLVFASRQVTDDTNNAPVTSVIHGSVRAVATYNITPNGVLTIDGVTLANGDRVLLNGQTNTTTNGIYVVNSAGAWTRSSDAASSSDFVPGFTVYVDKGGTTYGNTGWLLISSFPVTLGTTAIVFSNTLTRGWSNN